MSTPSITDFDELGRLACKAQDGDAAAYERFLTDTYGFVVRILRARLGAGSDVDDLVQDCIVGIHTSLHTYMPSRPIRPWLQAIIRYKLADYFRDRARSREVAVPRDILDVTNPSEPANDEAEGQAMTGPEIRSYVNQLPPALRRAVVRTKFDGMPGEEVAREEGIRPAALRKRVSRAYRKLARMIEEDRR